MGEKAPEGTPSNILQKHFDFFDCETCWTTLRGSRDVFKGSRQEAYCRSIEVTRCDFPADIEDNVYNTSTVKNNKLWSHRTVTERIPEIEIAIHIGHVSELLSL